MKYNDNNVLVSIAGRGEKVLLAKIKEINQRKITRVALFLTMADKTERRHIYQALLKSTIKEIPFVHLRNDISAAEVAWLEKNFQPRYYNIHENGFNYLHKWISIKKKIYLELAGHEKRNPEARIEKIGGFCVDLAHYKMGEVRQSDQFKYHLSKKKNKAAFVCNHLNGYDAKHNTCIHEVSRLSDFSYLKGLPNFIFGRLIALELENPIKEQLVWRKKLLLILNNRA